MRDVKIKKLKEKNFWLIAENKRLKDNGLIIANSLESALNKIIDISGRETIENEHPETIKKVNMVIKIIKDKFK